MQEEATECVKNDLLQKYRYSQKFANIVNTLYYTRRIRIGL